MIGIIRTLFEKKKKEDECKSIPRPTSAVVKINGKTKNKQKLKAELEDISMFQDISEDDDDIKSMIVESTDKNKNPYLYISFIFSKDCCEVFYTIPPEVANPIMRKLEVMKTAFTLLSILESEGAFIPEKEEFYARVTEAFDLSSMFANTDVLGMKYELDRYRTENATIRSEVERYKQENEGLNHQFVELEKKKEKLEERVRQLEGMTDNELDREILRWVEDHYGKLGEEKFCSSFGITGKRLEERLDSLSRRGVIRIG